MNGIRRWLTKPGRIWPKFIIIFTFFLLYSVHLQRQILEAGLSFPANFNILLESLWFAELLTFITIMLLLLFLPKQKFTKGMVVLLVLGVIALTQAAFFIGADSNQCFTSYPDKGLRCGTSWTHAIQKAPYHHMFDNHDYSLESEAPRLLGYQWPFLIGAGLTYLGIVVHESSRRLVKTKQQKLG